ncbi:MAG: acyltransferase [Treponema sp.]|nr:acyltransferase [Treponema sp.]
MIFILGLFILYCLITANYKSPFSKEFQSDFLSRESTSMINGIFVFLVFLAHFSQYIDDWWKYDSFFLRFFSLLGECVVCSFLFYSGYGMMEQIKKDKNAYLHKLMVKRLPSLWIKFAICVLLYVILAFIMKTDLTVSKVVLSFLGLSSVGNSAWYIFYMLFSYVVIYLSFRFINNNKISLAILFLIFIIYTGIIYHVKFDSPAYYLVSFVLPFGILFSMLKERFIVIFEKHYVLAFLTLILLYACSFLCRHFFKLGGWAYSFTAIAFTLVLILFTLKVHFKNNIIQYLGNHVFEIFILQRIPMIALKPFYILWSGVRPYSYLIYFILCLGCTLVLTYIMRLFFERMKL